MTKSFLLCDPLAGHELLEALTPEGLASVRVQASMVLMTATMVLESIEDSLPEERKEEFEHIPPDQRWGAVLLMCYQLEMAHQDDLSELFDLSLEQMRCLVQGPS